MILALNFKDEFMSTVLSFGRDTQGFNAYAPDPSTNIFSATLVNGAASTITLPLSQKYWIVSPSYQPGTNVFVDFTGATAAIPVGGTFSAATSELNPSARRVKSTQDDGVTAATISFITNNATAEVSVSLYAPG